MEGSLLFFGKHNLNGYIYYYHLPRMSFQFRKEISDKIAQYDGDMDDLQSKDFREEIKAFGDITFFHENELFNIQHNKSIKNNKLKCILIQDFENAISLYENKQRAFNNLITNGLPSNVQKESLVAVLLPNEVEKRTHYYEFPLLSNDNVKYGKSKYDILTYIPTIPGGFAVFCTLEEKTIVMEFLKKNSSKTIKEELKPKNTKKVKGKQKLLLTPEPAKEHLYCHLCKKKYKEYFSHLKGQLHIETMTQNNDNFKRLLNTFNRINNFWKNENGAIYRPVSPVNKIEKQQDSYITSVDKINTFVSQQETPQTQFNSIISGNNDQFQVKKQQDKKFGKRKYSQIYEGSFASLGEKTHYLRVTEPRIMNKVNECLKKHKK